MMKFANMPPIALLGNHPAGIVVKIDVTMALQGNVAVIIGINGQPYPSSRHNPTKNRRSSMLKYAPSNPYIPTLPLWRMPRLQVTTVATADTKTTLVATMRVPKLKPTGCITISPCHPQDGLCG